jgi:flagellar hook-associated protein 1 FlgK
MSITNVMNVALSGLNTNQAALQVTSNNIANVNTENYSRQQVVIQSRSLDGQPAGVELKDVIRVVDEFLNKELVSSNSSHGYYDALSIIHERLQATLGGPENLGSLHNLVDQAFASLNTLAVEPTQAPRRAGAIADLQNLMDGIDRLARQIQNLREEAERRVLSDIEAVNQELVEIHQLNKAIAAEYSQGNSPYVLEERRAQAIERISEIIDLRAVEMPNHFVHLSTVSGLNLLDQNLRELQYNPVIQADTSVTYNSITVHLVDEVSGVVATNGAILDTSLRAGSLKGWIDMRDIELPQVAVALGELAGKLADQFNRVHNEYSAVPPPNTLTGTNTGALATDPHGFTGSATFAVLDANNEITDSYTIDFTNAGLVTLQDVINDVNANLTGATLSLSNGVMVFDATNATDGVVIAQDATSPSSRGGRGFSHFFGMNSLVEARTASHFDTGLTGTAAHGFGASGTVQLSFSGPGGAIAKSYTLDFSTVGGTINAVLNELNTAFSGFATFALGSDGNVTMTRSTGYEQYDIDIGSDSAVRGTTGISFSEFFGIGDRFRMDAAFSMNVRSDIVSDPFRLALAQLDPAAPAGDPALTEADNRGADALFNLTSLGIVFERAGDLPSLNSTLSEYTSYLLSSTGMEANTAERMAQDRQALRDELKVRRDAVSGVNLDEELANMIIFQNAFNAAARLITTANEMYDTLLSISR